MRQLFAMFVVLFSIPNAQAEPLNLESIFGHIASDTDLKVSSGLYDVVGLEKAKIPAKFKPLFILTLNQMVGQTESKGGDSRDMPTRQTESHVSMTEKIQDGDEVAYKTRVLDIIEASETKLVLAAPDSKNNTVTYESIMENQLTIGQKMKVDLSFVCDEKITKISVPLQLVLGIVWGKTHRKVTSPQLELVLRQAGVELNPGLAETCDVGSFELSPAQ